MSEPAPIRRIDLDLPGPAAATRVVVAMSGGVDSSVVAALLKRQGYDVLGITLQLYDHGARRATGRSCCAGQDVHDARRVADQLAIPHYVLDYERRFRDAVIEPFAASYLAGETPVPCVRCNERVKFADLLELARRLGAAALATGHYVASRPRGDGSGHRELLTPADLDRDQSYFLFATTQAQLDFLRFPLGGLTKGETRHIAAELGLKVAEKPDSQDICFVPNGRYAEVVAKLRPEAGEAGEIVHLDGRRLGRHDGIVRFTVGQRRGLGIAAGEPLYVVRIDPASRRVVVGPRAALECRRLVLRDVNWLGAGEPAAKPHAVIPAEAHAVIPARAGIHSGEAVIRGDPVASGISGMDPGLRRGDDRRGLRRGDGLHDLRRGDELPEVDDIFVKIRSTRPPVPARLFRRGADALVHVPEGEVGVAPGQACVFYEGAGSGVRVLGGGWIARAEAQWQRNGTNPAGAGRDAAVLLEDRLGA